MKNRIKISGSFQRDKGGRKNEKITDNYINDSYVNKSCGLF